MTHWALPTWSHRNVRICQQRTSRIDKKQRVSSSLGGSIRGSSSGLYKPGTAGGRRSDEDKKGRGAVGKLALGGLRQLAFTHNALIQLAPASNLIFKLAVAFRQSFRDDVNASRDVLSKEGVRKTIWPILNLWVGMTRPAQRTNRAVIVNH